MRWLKSIQLLLFIGLLVVPAFGLAADSSFNPTFSGSLGNLHVPSSWGPSPYTGYSLGVSQPGITPLATLNGFERLALTMVQQAASGNPKAAGLGAVSSLLGAGFTSFLQDAPGWLKRTEVEFDITEMSKPEFSILTVQPLTQSTDYLNTLFSQGRIAYGRDGRTTLNLGSGYRRLVLREGLMLGVNAFFDYESPFDHRRVGLGSEIRSGPLELNVNYYNAISHKLKADSGTHERALDGYDLELGAQIPYLPWARLFGKYFYWDTGSGVSDFWCQYEHDFYLHLRNSGVRIANLQNQAPSLRSLTRLSANFLKRPSSRILPSTLSTIRTTTDGSRCRKSATLFPEYPSLVLAR
jgi:hypothetical protein